MDRGSSVAAISSKRDQLGLSLPWCSMMRFAIVGEASRSKGACVRIQLFGLNNMGDKIYFTS